MYFNYKDIQTLSLRNYRILAFHNQNLEVKSMHMLNWHKDVLTNSPSVLFLLKEIYSLMLQEHFQKRLEELDSRIAIIANVISIEVQKLKQLFDKYMWISSTFLFLIFQFGIFLKWHFEMQIVLLIFIFAELGQKKEKQDISSYWGI